MRYSPFRHIPSVLKKNRVIHLTVFLTRRCNARCSFCFYLSNSHQEQAIAQELTLDELERTAASVGTLLWLAFSGGEIFLRRDLAEIARVFYRHNKPAIILLPTNGLLHDNIVAQTEQIVRTCPKSTVVVKLSLDGPPPLHDQMRGVKGCYDNVLKTYRSLQDLQKKHSNLELGFNTVFCSINQELMPDIIDQVNRLDNEATHTVSLIRGNPKNAGLKRVDNESYRAAIKLLETRTKQAATGQYRFAGARLKSAQDIVQRRKIYETLCARKRTMPCYAGRLALVVTEQGDCYPCEAFAEKLGNLRDADFDLQSMLASPTARRIFQHIDNKGCYCTHECAFLLNILFNPRMYPAVLREYMALL